MTLRSPKGQQRPRKPPHPPTHLTLSPANYWTRKGGRRRPIGPWERVVEFPVREQAADRAREGGRGQGANRACEHAGRSCWCASIVNEVGRIFAKPILICLAAKARWSRLTRASHSASEGDEAQHGPSRNHDTPPPPDEGLLRCQCCSAAARNGDMAAVQRKSQGTHPVDAQGVDGIRRLSPACRDSPPNRPAVSVLVRLKRRAKVGPKVGPAKRIDMKS
jgi:hypothetical protein